MKLAALFVMCILLLSPGLNAQTLSLADLEKMAIEKNPTIAQSQARVAAARGMARQAGLYPNPLIGGTAEDFPTNPTAREGMIGFFVEQEIVLGGKLGKSRRAFEQDISRAETDAEAQRTRVLNTVRSNFYRVLAAQRKVEVRTQLGNLVRTAAGVSKQLQNVGQADLPDVLEIEVEEQRAELAVLSARNELVEMWQQLVATVGDPNLRLTPLAGDIEQLPDLDADQALTALLRDSPEIKAAQTGIARAEASLSRAQAEKVPNLEVRGGLEFNRKRVATTNRQVGWEGFLDIGIRIPLFDRNQGGVAAARAELTEAQREVDRVRLSLRARLASAYKQYLDARDAAQRYKAGMLPRAQQAYDLYLIKFRQMAAAYPQALIAQRTLLQLQEEYNDVLATAWDRAIEIRGLLLNGGL
jgi:outer membrane protein, heavy metal efflux system